MNMANNISRKRICIITTMWSSIENWIIPFLPAYHKNNIEVTVVCNMNDEFERRLHNQYPYVITHYIAFPRGIDFFGSIRSIFELIKLFNTMHFDMVQYSTPNASLYASIAAYFCRIPVRLYCQWGMVFVTMKGIKRYLFNQIERIVCKLSTNIQPDSKGNLDYCRKLGFYDATKSCVIWNGSAKGLDLNEYDITKKEEYALEIKKRYGINLEETVIGFVGRLGRDKGCNELFEVFRRIKKEKLGKIKLLFVGPLEKKNTIEPNLLDFFENESDIIKTGRVSDVEKHMAAMDVFVLPSHREGFGMSVIEASAMGVPVVTTEYPGPSSAMINGVTGITVPIGDTDELAKAIAFLISNIDQARRMGNAGRVFVEQSFDREEFSKRLIDNRLTLLGLNQ